MLNEFRRKALFKKWNDKVFMPIRDKLLSGAAEG